MAPLFLLGVSRAAPQTKLAPSLIVYAEPKNPPHGLLPPKQPWTEARWRFLSLVFGSLFERIDNLLWILGVSLVLLKAMNREKYRICWWGSAHRDAVAFKPT